MNLIKDVAKRVENIENSVASSSNRNDQDLKKIPPE